MVSSSNCANVTSHYHLCDQTTELKPDLEACYHWKKGNFAESENCILALILNSLQFPNNILFRILV